MSLALFILMADVLSRLLKLASFLSLLRGIRPLDTFQDIKSLQFANDTLFFYSRDKGSLVVAKAILLAFKGASSLKINMYKNSFIYLNMDDQEADTFLDLLNYSRSKLPIIYLGLPLYDRKGRLLFWDGTLSLINCVLSALPSYYNAIFKLSKWVIVKIDQMRRTFLQKGSDKVSSFHCLTNRDLVCRPTK